MNIVRRALMIGALCALLPQGSTMAADQRPFALKAFEDAQGTGESLLFHVTA